MLPHKFLGSAKPSNHTYSELHHGVKSTYRFDQSNNPFAQQLIIRYLDTAVQYCQIPVEDTLEQDLSTHFKTAADFIHKAVSNNGRALVHCERVLPHSGELQRFVLINTNSL